MSAKHLRNISVSQFESFLELACCKFLRTNGGHDIWSRADLTRPITFQNHIEPIPEFIIKNALKTLMYSKNDFFDILESKKVVTKKSERRFVLDSSK